MFLFKIWANDRSKKVFVTFSEDTDDLLTKVLQKASEKINIRGVNLVLESDGTEIDSEETLKVLHKETFILLQESECWKPASESFQSLPSTITVASESASTYGSPDGSVSHQQDSEHASTPTSSRTSEFSWSAFTIPWDKMSPATIADCEAGSRNKRAIADIIHVVVNNAREIKKNIPSKAFKFMAHKLISKYPKTFMDIDEDGVILGDGSHSIFAKLQDHNNYLNRTPKRPGENPNNVPLNKKRKMMASKAGCVNWEAEVETSNNELTDDKVKDILMTKPFGEIEEEILNKAYNFQRSFINDHEQKSMQSIKQEWPILFSKQGLFWHYEKLMTQDIHLLSENLKKKTRKILNFGLSKKYIGELPEESSNALTILEIFLKFFKESRDWIFREVEINPTGNITNPIIIRNVQNNNMYIMIENTTVCENENEDISFEEALCILFACYYVFNLAYPKGAANTLEMIQKYFLKIHPDQGTKNTKKTPKSKLISLINQLKSFA